jgi:hypothetical protein
MAMGREPPGRTAHLPFSNKFPERGMGCSPAILTAISSGFCSGRVTVIRIEPIGAGRSLTLISGILPIAGYRIQANVLDPAISAE